MLYRAERNCRVVISCVLAIMGDTVHVTYTVLIHLYKNIY